jgi:hypothetical protein
MTYITVVDYLLLLVYLFFIFYFIKLKAIKYKGTTLYKYFIYGFLAHMGGCILYAMVVQYYYGYGDSFGFYQGGQAIRKILANNGNPFSTFFLDGEELLKIYKLTGDDDIYMQAGISNNASLIIYKITAVFSYISFNSYLIISLFFGLFSFAGVWKMFCVFNELLNKYQEKILVYSIVFLPSICFWGSGLMKDSLCLGFVGFIFSSGYGIFVKKSYRLSNFLVLLLSLYFLYLIKSYIASTLVLAAILTYLIGIILRSKGNIIKLSFVLLVLLVSGLFLSFSISSTMTSVIEESKSQIENFKNSYESSSDADENSMAGFKEADFEFTISSIILRVPLKTTSTLYRPFIWETRKPIMMFSAVESFLMLLAAIFVLIRCRVTRFFYYIAINPEIFFAFVFTALLAAVVGFTTFNFGSMVRYRLPILPFYCFMLIAIYKKNIEKQAIKTL